MLYVFCMECRDKITINKRYNAYSVVASNGKRPRVDFAIARQPRAIKRTTRTELHHEGIYNGIYILWDIGIISTVLRRCDIRNDKCTHCNIDIILTAICTIVSFVCKQIVCYGMAFLFTLLFNPC